MRNSFRLFLISFIALFLELAIIRWLSSEIRIFAYFKNLPLMAAFLGFGLGFYLHTKSEKLFPWFPKLFCALVIIIAGAIELNITHVVFADPRQYFLLGSGFGDHLAESAPSLLQTLKALFVIVSIFFLVMATFACLTSKLGEFMNQEKPLKAYSINILGSLAGILSFSLISYLGASPLIWLCLAFIPLLYFYRTQTLYFVIALAFTGFMAWVNPATWSPYYRISTTQNGGVLINYDAFQAMHNLSTENLKKLPEYTQKIMSRHYNIPYNLAKRPIKSVLILGGGSGNDAAAALRNDVQKVDVIEIDPVIAQLGYNTHPERPYKSPKVKVHIDDARSFLHKTKNKYDLIVFATLDSHVVFSSLSSLRLDNFVFTTESLQDAKNALKPDGGIIINFFTSKPWLSQRHFETLKMVTGTEPLSYHGRENQEAIFLSGNLFEANKALSKTNYILGKPEFASNKIELTTDNWPFLFLEKKGIPFHYLLPLCLILLLSLVPLKAVGFNYKEMNLQLFFMGAAFLLLETKAVTTLSLIFGSTWLVNSIVIGAILLTILLANTLCAKAEAEKFSKWEFNHLYVGLGFSLLLNYFFDFEILNNLNFGLKLSSSTLIITSPIFFAALIFAKAFSQVESASLALASNLLGSLIGGLFEYSDMWLGLKSLNLLAFGLYFASYLCSLNRNSIKIKNELFENVKIPAFK